MKDQVLGGLFGVIVGDALGVPVEFVSRNRLRDNPVTDMTGYGTYNLPPGSWSDDSSLTLCLIESLCKAGFDLDDAARRFISWYRQGHWTPYGEVFDVGGTTREAIERLEQRVSPALAGPADERSNGNGSLMRIMPAALYFACRDEKVMRDAVCQVSCITHGHPRSQLACVLYSLFVRALLKSGNPRDAYEYCCERVQKIGAGTVLAAELPHYGRILAGTLPGLAESEIRSDGYVVSTLEASIWSLLNSSTFSETVLKAVNLGDDSDTTGAVAGGLAGVYYGYDSIPGDWLQQLARFAEIETLVERFAAVLNESFMSLQNK